MLLKDYTENILFGTAVIETHKGKKSQDALILLTSESIQDEAFNFEKVQYLPLNNFRKYYLNKPLLEHGDYVIEKQSMNIVRFEEAEQKVMPSEDFIILKSPRNYLGKYLSNVVGKAYFKNELKRVLNSENFFEKIGKINIHDDFAKVEEINDNTNRKDKTPISVLSINVRKGLMTLDKILKRIKHNEINLDTEFQRGKDLWKAETKCRFIEALIVKQPVPALYFDATNDFENDIWEVVDGLQRLCTLRDFVLDEKSFELKDLFYLPQYEGKTFSQLPRSAQRNIEEYEFIAYIIEPPTPKDVKYKIFKSINTSALNLEAQEIRHALNPGSPADLVKKIAASASFIKTIPISYTQRDRMADREIALRYLAFRMTHYKDIVPNSTELLDKAMTLIYEKTEIQLTQYQEDLESTLLLIDDVFGFEAYTKAIIGMEDTGFVNPMFEIWTYALSVLSAEKREVFRSRKKVIREKCKSFLGKDTNFVRAFESPYTKKNIEIRFSTVENFVKQVTQ